MCSLYRLIRIGARNGKQESELEAHENETKFTSAVLGYT
jgi:hypothetical protein